MFISWYTARCSMNTWLRCVVWQNTMRTPSIVGTQNKAYICSHNIYQKMIMQAMISVCTRAFYAVGCACVFGLLLSCKQSTAKATIIVHEFISLLKPASCMHICAIQTQPMQHHACMLPSLVILYMACVSPVCA